MTKRKTPVKHIVKAHKREGATVYSYNRGHGQNHSEHLANPTPTHLQKLMPATVQRLVRKLGFEGLGNWNTLTFDDLKNNPDVQKALLNEYAREQKIIDRHSNDNVAAQMELILDHAKRLVDQGVNKDAAWNTAVGYCRFQTRGVLEPFGYEINQTEVALDKLDKYAKAHAKTFKTFVCPECNKEELIDNGIVVNAETRHGLKHKVRLCSKCAIGD